MTDIDEAELQRQMERAEMENAEVAGDDGDEDDELSGESDPDVGSDGDKEP